MKHALATLDEALDWLQDHWSEQRQAPIRLHDGHTTDGELGGLAYSGAMAATLAWKPDEVRQVTSTVICQHRFAPGKRGEDCPECQGDGVYDATHDRYPYPMTLALARLGHVVQRPNQPHPIALLYALAEHGWSFRILRRLLPLAPDLTEALTLRAIRQLHDRYEAGPVAKAGWVSLSDSQRNAIIAGEATA